MGRVVALWEDCYGNHTGVKTGQLNVNRHSSRCVNGFVHSLTTVCVRHGSSSFVTLLLMLLVNTTSSRQSHTQNILFSTHKHFPPPRLISQYLLSLHRISLNPAITLNNRIKNIEQEVLVLNEIGLKLPLKRIRCGITGRH